MRGQPCALALLYLGASSVWATSVALPPDLGQLARTSELVGVFLIQKQLPGPAFTTWVLASPEIILKGQVGDAVRIQLPGGSNGEVALAVAGFPRFTVGDRYLLFLGSLPEGFWQPAIAALGVFRAEKKTFVPVPEAQEVAVIQGEPSSFLRLYYQEELLAELKNAIVGLPYELDRAVAGEAPHQTGHCVRMTHNNGIPVRWFSFETGFSFSMAATTPGQTGLADGGVGAVQSGTAAWRNYSAAKLNLNYGGVQPRTLDCAQGNYRGQVWFNDPCNQIRDLSGCQGILAIGGSYYSLTPQTYDGQTWYPGFIGGSLGPFVVVNNGAECIGPTNFAEMMTHELGHTLFFGHHTDPQAVMYFSCCRGYGAQIYTTDKVCASVQYHTFLDVPYSHWAWSYIEGVEDAGVSSGCGGGNYCPESQITRAQMAVFLLKAKYGSSYAPPACTGVFTDVPCPSYWAAAWIEALAAEGITSGCGGGKYCPENPVTRAQMAVFLLKAKYGSSYVPPPCTGVFSDVPCPGHWAAAWIEALAAEGITSGCGGGQYCPQNPVTRAQMAVFLVRAFSLPRP